MGFRFDFRMKSARCTRPQFYRPVLEGLEDRDLPSGGFGQVNLASDVPGLARTVDPNLVNPWGIASSPTGPFWFADNGRGTSDILDGRGQPFALVVPLPAATGMVFNGGPGFAVAENGVTAPSRFLFAGEDGTIAGWSAVVDSSRAILAVDQSSAGAVYKGLALATDPTGHSFLYAADFGRGTIDVFDQDFRLVTRPGSFRDPALPDGFAPFNIQSINDRLFVTYAQQDDARHDDIAGAGHGFIDVYDTGGNLLMRFAAEGALNSPWGLALAPAGFGSFGGDLLVGNNGDGRINAYDPASGAFLGPLVDDQRVPITIPTLWTLRFGNGHEGGAANTLFFTAGINYEQDGLFGAIQAPQDRGADTAGTGPFDPHAPGEPGDYPLPPRGGPALQTSSADRQAPTADLLPLSGSSLALVPTLSTVTAPTTRVDVSARAVPSRGIPMSESVLATSPAYQSRFPAPASGDSGYAAGDLNEFVGLNTFLDVNITADIPHLEAPASADFGRGLPPQSAHVDEWTAADPLERHSEPTAGRIASTDAGDSGNDSTWAALTKVLFVSLPLLWAYWARRMASLCVPSFVRQDLRNSLGK